MSYIFNHFRSSIFHFSRETFFKWGGIINGIVFGNTLIFSVPSGKSSNIPFSFKKRKPLLVEAQQKPSKLAQCPPENPFSQKDLPNPQVFSCFGCLVKYIFFYFAIFLHDSYIIIIMNNNNHLHKIRWLTYTKQFDVSFLQMDEAYMFTLIVLGSANNNEKRRINSRKITIRENGNKNCQWFFSGIRIWEYLYFQII